MKERIQEIITADGRMPVFVTHPEQDAPFPAVILYMDFWGVREELYDLARRIATVGYYCAVPDLYYRQGRIRNERRDTKGRMRSFHLLEPAEREMLLEPLRKLSDEMAMADTAAMLDFMDAGEPVHPRPMACIGYCLGGRLVVRAGARFPDRFAAMVSMHPTDMVTASPSSPHLDLKRLRGEIYFGLAELDRHSPPAMIDALRSELSCATVKFQVELHRGIDHGYALPDRDIHDRAAADRDWECVFAMFRRRLNPLKR